jgi:hypothetical protein
MAVTRIEFVPKNARGVAVMKRFTTVLAVVFAAMLALTTSASGQGLQTGTLSGVVKDPDGLALPGATVTVTAPVLQGERTAVTDAIGAYIIRGLPPGNYTVRFQFAGTADVEQTAVVPLGGVAEVDATLMLAGVQEAVRVSADLTPPPLAQTQLSTNFTAETVNALPVGRRPFEIAELAPGVTDNTPNAGQIAIGGAFAFDSIFLVDGVDVNDNLSGSANGLFIEDGIAETQVLTGGISAEYGRFGGGVVNVITRSGGNDFHGSFRTNFARPSWSDETPFEDERIAAGLATPRASTLSKFFEGTIGGPVVRDRLWFFNADRYEDSVTGRTFAETGGAYNSGVNNKRFELKLTGTPAVNHTVSGTFVNNPTSQTDRASIDPVRSMDPFTLVSPTSPNRLWVLNWSGVLTNKLFATFQFSDKDQGFRDTGGTSTAIIDSPFLTRGTFGLGVAGGRHFNAPYFSAIDPEDRNNRQFAGSLSYYVTNPTIGRHDLKVGGEHFNSWRTGGNSQSSTGYVFQTDVVFENGRPALDSTGRPIPVWVPAANGSRTLIQNWLSFPGSTLDIYTLSLYVQDRWQVGNRVTADLGLRFENVDSEATGDIVGADTTAWLPRLGVSFDIEGNGRTVAQATYGRYSGRFTERAFARNTNVGTPSLLLLAYTGPAGEGRDFAPGFDLANYAVVGGNFPTANVSFDPDLTSPKTNEFTLSLGREIPRGYGKVTYTWRNTSSFIDDFINDPTAAGKVEVVRDGRSFGTFDRVLYKNTDLPTREYQAMQFEGRVNVVRLPIQGHYTVQIKNHGTFEGEAGNQPGNPSIWLDYPEMLPVDRYAPYGRLDEFQRHKFRLWTTYNQSLGRAGSVDISPIWRVNSGLTYSHAAASVGMSEIQRSLNPGYARANTTTATLFFDERGTESFKGYGMLDMSFRYGIPVWKSVQPWIQAHVFNVMNNQKQIQWNTTVTADPNSPLDAFGQPTGFIKGPTYGQATANTHFPVWSSGETGGRTFRIAMGVRF